jgi:carbonic anhydrase
LDGECDGKFQSPIDLVDVCKQKNETVIVDRSLGLVFINYDRTLDGKQLLLENNGHTAEIRLKGSDKLNNAIPQLSGSAVGFNKFQLQQIHFHWNRNASHGGSEHSLFGKMHAFEMHLVHFNTKYDASDDATDHPDGSAVLSVFFDYYDCEEDKNAGGRECAENTPENQALRPITQKLRDVDDSDETTCLDEDLNLKNLLPRDTRTFYWYQGSLTTPPCLENLTWIVFPEVQNISKQQLKSFEFNFKNDDGKVLGTTNRVVQPLNGRLLLISRDDHCNGKEAVPKGQESDNFAENTNIEISAQQTVAETDGYGDDGDDSDGDGDIGSSSSNSKGKGGGEDHQNRRKEGASSENSGGQNDGDSGKGSSGTSGGGKDNKKKDNGSDSKENGKSSSTAGNSSTSSDKGNGTTSGNSNTSNSSSGSRGKRDDDCKNCVPSGWDGKRCTGKSSDPDDRCAMCDRDGDGKIDSPCDATNSGNGPPAGPKNTGDNGGVLSNLLGVDRPFGLYGKTPTRRKRQSGRSNGGVLSDATGVDRPYGLYGDKPGRRKRQSGRSNGGVLSDATGVDRPFGLYGNTP